MADKHTMYFKIPQLLSKVVVTVGPACMDKLDKLIKAGASVFRINAAHVTSETGREAVQAIRDAQEKTDTPVLIMLDLAGPKIRVGKLKDEPKRLSPGDEVELVAGTEAKDDKIPIKYDDLGHDLKKGHRILLADGSIELSVMSVKQGVVKAKVVVGGPLLSRKGVNFPDIPTNLPALTEKDIRDLKWGLKEDIDIISLSFVRSPNDIRQLRAMMNSQDRDDLPIVAKLEKPQALENLESIMEVVDAVMVARGDLGIELPFNEIGIHQKRIIKLAVEMARPVITATQVLLSMVENPYPTRAEVTDITNAVLDGSDGIMLSDETTGGKHPEQAVKVLAAVIRTSHEYYRDMSRLRPYREDMNHPEVQHSVCYSAYVLAERVNAKAILVPTWSGSTARIIASYRPRQPIYAFTAQQHCFRLMSLMRGVQTVMIDPIEELPQLIAEVKFLALEKTHLTSGDKVVIIAGYPAKKTDVTHWVQVEQL